MNKNRQLSIILEIWFKKLHNTTVYTSFDFIQFKGEETIYLKMIQYYTDNISYYSVGCRVENRYGNIL
jgi:hypothetical protein